MIEIEHMEKRGKVERIGRTMKIFHGGYIF